MTGASGHVGANLVRELIAEGFSVRALVHTTSKAISGLEVEPVYGDIMDLNSLPRACEGVGMVFHAAGYISIRESE